MNTEGTKKGPARVATLFTGGSGNCLRLVAYLDTPGHAEIIFRVHFSEKDFPAPSYQQEAGSFFFVRREVDALDMSNIVRTIQYSRFGREMDGPTWREFLSNILTGVDRFKRTLKDLNDALLAWERQQA